MKPEEKGQIPGATGRYRELTPAKKPLLWLFGSLLFSWWILTYWLFGLLWYPPKVGPMGRFAIFYGLVVLGAIPVSVALVWVGRRVRQLPLRVALAVATPALLWAALLVWGTHSMDRIHLSVIGVQAAVAAYFLTLAGIMRSLGKRWGVSKVAIRSSLGILLVSQFICYSIEVWRLTAYRHEYLYGAVLVEHDLFSTWTFVVALVSTLLACVVLVLPWRRPGTGAALPPAAPTAESVAEAAAEKKGKGHSELRFDQTGRLVHAILLYVGLTLGTSAIVWALKSAARSFPVWFFVGVLLLAGLTWLLCWRLALIWGRPAVLLSVRVAGQRQHIAAVLFAGLPVFAAAAWLWVTADVPDNQLLSLAALPVGRLFSTFGAVLLTQGFLVGLLAREGRGPWFTIGAAAVIATATGLIALLFFHQAPFTWAVTGWGLLGTFLSTALLAWMTLKLGSIIPVGLFSWLTWMGMHYVWKIAFLDPPDHPDIIGLWLLAACAPLLAVGIGMCLVKPFVELEPLGERSLD